MNENQIKNILEEFRINKKVIEKLKKVADIDSILNVAFKYKMYDTILELFKPIIIDGEIKMYFDIFSYVSLLGLKEFIERFDVSETEKQNIIKAIYNIDIEQMKQMKIGNSLAREISGWSHPITSINDVIYYAEPACLESMIYLFNSNIRTTMNDTAGVYGENNDNGVCCIWIDYDSLSEENKAIANQLLANNHARYIDGELQTTISVEVPCSKNETIGNVSDKLKNIIQSFVKQPMLYGFHSKEEIIAKMRKYIEDGIYNNSYLNYPETFQDHCFKLITTGQVQENPNGEVGVNEKTYLFADLVDAIANSDSFFQNYIEEHNFYYDPDEEKYWESKALYERYVMQKAEEVMEIPER